MTSPWITAQNLRGHAPRGQSRVTRYRLTMLCAIVGWAISGWAWALESESFFKASYLDLPSDARQAATAGHILMVVYEQEGCSYCARMHKVNFADAEILALMKRHFEVVQLDIWGARELNNFAGQTVSEKQFARDLKIQLSPMINFFDGNGKEIFRMAGYYPPDKFKAALRYVANGDVARMRFRDYLAQNTATAAGDISQEAIFSPADDLNLALTRARARGKGLALMFEQPGCAACEEMHQKTLRDPRASALFNGAFDIVQINTVSSAKIKDWAGAETTLAGLAKAQDVSVTPTILFLDAQGQAIFRYDSYRTPEDFYVILLYLSSDAYRRYASFQDWLRAEYIPQQQSATGTTRLP